LLPNKFSSLRNSEKENWIEQYVKKHLPTTYKSYRAGEDTEISLVEYLKNIVSTDGLTSLLSLVEQARLSKIVNMIESGTQNPLSSSLSVTTAINFLLSWQSNGDSGVGLDQTFFSEPMQTSTVNSILAATGISYLQKLAAFRALNDGLNREADREFANNFIPNIVVSFKELLEIPTLKAIMDEESTTDAAMRSRLRLINRFQNTTHLNDLRWIKETITEINRTLGSGNDDESLLISNSCTEILVMIDRYFNLPKKYKNS
jgi:hypothetical protein